MSVSLIGTIASGNETPPPTGALDAIMEVITNMCRKIEATESHLSTIQGSVLAIDGRMINVEGQLNSTNTTSQTTY